MAEKELRWSERALEENNKLVDYLLTEWGEDVALRIKEQINKAASRIHLSPGHYQIFPKSKKIHRCVVTQQTSIFFKISKKEIVIISVFDNRQSPKKRKL